MVLIFHTNISRSTSFLEKLGPWTIRALPRQENLDHESPFVILKQVTTWHVETRFLSVFRQNIGMRLCVCAFSNAVLYWQVCMRSAQGLQRLAPIQKEAKNSKWGSKVLYDMVFYDDDKHLSMIGTISFEYALNNYVLTNNKHKWEQSLINAENQWRMQEL